MSPILDLIVLGRSKGIIGITAMMPEPAPEPVSGTPHVAQQQQGEHYSDEHIRQQQVQRSGQ